MGLEWVKIILVSSAYRVNLENLDDLFIDLGKSLMYRRKSNEPIIEPCGIPDFIISQSER
jgi:hypothetical protein